MSNMKKVFYITYNIDAFCEAYLFPGILDVGVIVNDNGAVSPRLDDILKYGGLRGSP